MNTATQQIAPPAVTELQARLPSMVDAVRSGLKVPTLLLEGDGFILVVSVSRASKGEVEPR